LGYWEIGNKKEGIGNWKFGIGRFCLSEVYMDAWDFTDYRETMALINLACG
jgi:hypothetical protein